MDALEVFLACFLALGLALVLYTAPLKYTELQKTLMLGGGGIFLLIATWHAAVRITYIVLSGYLDAAKTAGAEKAVKGLQVPASYELIGVACFASYWLVVQINRAIERTRQRRGQKPR